MIKIRKGNTRIALIIFSFLVIKFPNPRFDWHVSSFKSRKNFFTFLTEMPSNVYGAFLYGVTANISEGLLCYLNKHKQETTYLTRVVTFGICSFQMYQGEEKPTGEEIKAMYNGLSPKSREWLEQCDCHEYSPHNWRKTSQGLRLIDYAPDPLRTAWAAFLRGSRQELNQATTKQ